jgi:2',3'-cyclic-nucleotide 2'-phosphodiesterase (5'-nucleotidase family)
MDIRQHAMRSVADEVETSRQMVKALRPKADILIALSHSGDQADRQISASVPEIDVIVGGHSHSRLPVGEFVWHSSDIKPDNVNGTVIVQAHQWGGELGRLDLFSLEIRAAPGTLNGIARGSYP